MVMPRAGTLQNLFVRHNASAGNGVPVTYTVFVNGVATPLAVTVPTMFVGEVGDTVDSVVVAQGDRVTIEISKPGSIGGGGVKAVATLELA